MTKDCASNGDRIEALNDGNNADVTTELHRKWTRQETLTLIQAKVFSDNTPHKGKKLSSSTGSAARSSLSSSSSLQFDDTEPKWMMISHYCKMHGVERSHPQCKKRYTRLMHDFKKVKSWEAVEGKTDSFWNMSYDLRKERELPLSFDIEVYKVLEGHETGAAGALSPLPLRVVAAGSSSAIFSDYSDFAIFSDGANEFFDKEDMEEDELDEEDEKMLNGQYWLSFEDEVLEELESPALGWTMEDIKTADTVIESPVDNFFSPEPVSEDHYNQALQEQNRNLKQDASEESWPDFSNWTPQDKGKRRRLSTDEHIPFSSEAQIVRVLEEYNKLIAAQLDSLNKNCQLYREQRKENNSELMATLTKLTDLLTKIADKL